MCKKIPARSWVAMMIFWGTFVNFMFRSHFQISLLAMVEPRDNETVEDYGPRFDWSYEWEQQSISALFYGLSVSSLPAGYFVSWFGPWNIMMWTSIIMAVCTDLAVLMAYYVGAEGLFAMRFFVGLMIGLQYPSMENLISNWAPTQETGKFVACMMGNSLGSIITMPIVGLIIEAWGWEWSFYSLTAVIILYCTGLILLVADHPRNYRWIRQEEMEFIEASHGTSVNTEKRLKYPPYRKIFISCPAWALIISQCGNQYLLYLALTTVPQYLKRRLAFNLKASAGIAALPYVARLICGFSFGAINDCLIKRGVHKKYCRKGFTIFSHLLAGGTLFLFIVIGENAAAAISLLVIMMSFNSAAVVTTLINPVDLAPNWSGTLLGNMNCFGAWSGFLGPLVVQKITTENTFTQWAIVFAIGGVIGFVSGIIFIIFGSVELQPWNQIEDMPQSEQPVK